MSDTTTTRSSAYSATTTPSGWDAVPCVQYGFPEDKGPIRAPKLKTIFEPAPEGANTASPVYLLPPEEFERQNEFENGYEVSGTSSIGKELQDRCEDDDRVLYPIHIESDVYHDEDAQTLIEWFRNFTEDWLDVPFHDCSLYFSGNRSIHAHVPRFVHGEEQRELLKKRAETFCEETGAELDVGLYYRKRLFRLPGVTHESSTLPKVRIQPEWEHERIISEAASADTHPPASYAEVLRDVFAVQGRVTQATAPSLSDEPHALFDRVLDMDAAVLELECDEREVETPLIERKECPDNPSDVPEWAMYRGAIYSPYTHAKGNPRSVAVVKVKGTPFARKRITIGNSSQPAEAVLPAYFYGAIGCNGEFTKEQEHAPLQLSKQDYGKWDAKPGDNIVIIGGQSRNSVILDVDASEARHVGHALTGEDASRKAALEYLTEEEYDVGSAGSTSSSSSSGGESRITPKRIYSARANPQSPAERLQRQAEQNGIETLSHDDRRDVACRVLKWGWEPSWKWFKQQFGADFDPNITREQFLSAIETFPEDYEHVDVPQKPG